MKKYLVLLGIISLFLFTCITPHKAIEPKEEIVKKRDLPLPPPPPPVEKPNVGNIDSFLNRDGVQDGVQDGPDLTESLGTSAGPIGAGSRFKQKEYGTEPKKMAIASNSSTGSPMIPVVQNDEITLGEVVYRIPDTMVVFKEYKVTVRIGKKIGTTEIRANIAGQITTAIIPTTSRMEVTLMDPDPDSSFAIKRINSDKQIVDTLGYTEWGWMVKPIRHGKKSLNLVVSIIRGDNVKQKVYSDSINVKENVKGEVSTFWGKYWQWLFTTFLIPIFVYFWKKKKKDKEED